MRTKIDERPDCSLLAYEAIVMTCEVQAVREVVQHIAGRRSSHSGGDQKRRLQREAARVRLLLPCGHYAQRVATRGRASWRVPAVKDKGKLALASRG
jgi:hypothetical protein